MIVITAKLEVIFEESIKFDDLKKYKTSGGCHVHEDGLTVTAPTVMWVEVYYYHTSYNFIRLVVINCS